jgi:hypothetical protein
VALVARSGSWGNAMLYSECVTLIRDRLQAESVDTLADAAIARTFDSVYLQWWNRFSKRISTLTTAAMSSGYVDLSTANDYADVVSVMVGTKPLIRRPLDEVRWLIDNASTAAGFTTAAGTSEFYAVMVAQSATTTTSGAWRIYAFPTSTSTLTVNYKTSPVKASTITASAAFECDEDVQVGLCALTSLRLMAAVGKQNDQGLIQTLISEIPQEMQAMALPPKHSEVLPAPEGV